MRIIFVAVLLDMVFFNQVSLRPPAVFHYGVKPYSGIPAGHSLLAKCIIESAGGLPAGAGKEQLLEGKAQPKATDAIIFCPVRHHGAGVNKYTHVRSETAFQSSPRLAE